MKKIILLALLIATCSSCDVMKAERDYNLRVWELKKKDLELDYLERLYHVKSGIDIDEMTKTLDSLIADAKL